MNANNAIAERRSVALSEIVAYHAQRDPDRPFLTFEDRTVTRRQFDLATNRLARSFQALGVKPDDLVTIALPNGPAYIEMAFAAWKCGAIPHPISWRLPLLEAQGLVD